MSVSMKTLSKPQRALLQDVQKGRVHASDQVFSGVKIYRSTKEWDRLPVPPKTWDVLLKAGLVARPQPTLRTNATVELTESGRRVLAGETVNTAKSLLLTFEIDGHVVERRVPLPNWWWSCDEDGRPRNAKVIQSRVLSEIVSSSWSESDLPPDAAPE